MHRDCHVCEQKQQGLKMLPPPCPPHLLPCTAPGLAGKRRRVLGKGLDESLGHEASSTAKKPGWIAGSHSVREEWGVAGVSLSYCTWAPCAPALLTSAPCHARWQWSCMMAHGHRICPSRGTVPLGNSTARVPERRAARSHSAKGVGRNTGGGSHCTRTWKVKAKLPSSKGSTL